MFGSLVRFGGRLLLGPGKKNGKLRRRSASTGGGAESTAGRPGPNFGGARQVLGAAVACGSLSLLGDSLAQSIASFENGSNALSDFDIIRSGRMASFGLLFYGPFQHYWYGLLGWQFPLKTTSHFLTKVLLNQVVLGPIVCTTVFSWVLLLTGKAREFPNKMSADFFPTIYNGWKFWVPAAAINFWCIPLPLQVLYMSSCSVVWTGYLSYASNSMKKLD
ncbi:hypothetical protein BSKO_06982 [Bryopsis sp. KO-2023]|nr:hypothetical protein BSKO_06982 [Bryopsis sp. KO-2023]